jgi:thioredoxin 1
MIKVCYFTATWCGPCKVFGPVLTETIAEFSQDVELEKIDVDDKPELVTELQVKGFPTIILFNKDKEISRHTGLMSKTKLQQVIINAITKL